MLRGKRAAAKDLKDKSNMEWTSSKKQLPAEGAEVLVLVKKEFFLAMFSKASGGFRLHDGSFLWIEHEEVLWTRLVRP